MTSVHRLFGVDCRYNRPLRAHVINPDVLAELTRVGSDLQQTVRRPGSRQLLPLSEVAPPGGRAKERTKSTNQHRMSAPAIRGAFRIQFHRDLLKPVQHAAATAAAASAGAGPVPRRDAGSRATWSGHSRLEVRSNRRRNSDGNRSHPLSGGFALWAQICGQFADVSGQCNPGEGSAWENNVEKFVQTPD